MASNLTLEGLKIRLKAVDDEIVQILDDKHKTREGRVAEDEVLTQKRVDIAEQVVEERSMKDKQTEIKRIKEKECVLKERIEHDRRLARERANRDQRLAQRLADEDRRMAQERAKEDEAKARQNVLADGQCRKLRVGEDEKWDSCRRKLMKEQFDLEQTLEKLKSNKAKGTFYLKEEDKEEISLENVSRVSVAQKRKLTDAEPAPVSKRKTNPTKKPPIPAKPSSDESTAQIVIQVRAFNMPAPLHTIPTLPEASSLVNLDAITGSSLSMQFGEGRNELISTTYRDAPLVGIFRVDPQQMLPGAPGPHGVLLNVFKPIRFPMANTMALFISDDRNKKSDKEELFWYAGHHRQEGSPRPLVGREFFQSLSIRQRAKWATTIFHPQAKSISQDHANRILRAARIQSGHPLKNQKEVQDMMRHSAEKGYQPQNDQGSIYLWMTMLRCVFFDKNFYERVTMTYLKNESARKL